MPQLFQHKILKDATLCVWKITEKEAYFINNCKDNWDYTELKKLKGGRRLEWIASRFLIQKMTKNQYQIKKDKFGKPHLKPKDFHISISHSHGYVAAMVSKKLIGIDIQKKVSKIERIEHKFINNQEASFINNRFHKSNLHIIWGAKESLYKAYGRKEVDFKKNLFIHPFLYRKTNNFEGHIDIKGRVDQYNIGNLYFNNFYLVFCEKI